MTYATRSPQPPKLTPDDMSTLIKLRRRGGVWREVRRDAEIVQLEVPKGASFIYEFDRECLSALWQAGFITCVPRARNGVAYNEWRVL